MLKSTLFLILAASVSAFVPSSVRPSNQWALAPSVVVVVVETSKTGSSSIHRAINGIRMSGTTDSTTAPSTDFLKELLEHLTGERLLAASSESWRKAIYEAVGAPPTADSKAVAQTLEDAMSKPDNQFAILLGKAEDFVATFPSDTVSYDDDETCWVECRLRDSQTDALLVTMGINLTNQNGNWAISSLDWQDFRDEFYPGLSGREWLRSF